MEKQNFWNDAAKYGTIIALVSIAFSLIGMYLKSGFVSFASLAVFVVMLYMFTKRRAALYGGGSEGYGYGKCLSFIVCMMLFTGVLEGAYTIVASKWLFAAEYEQVWAKSVVMLQNTGFYSRDQLDMVIRLQSSPAVLIFGGMLGSVLKGAFFGLFVAGFARRSPNIFAGSNEQ